MALGQYRDARDARPNSLIVGKICIPYTVIR